MDHYQTLGVERGAGDDEVKAAYRRAAASAHPDRDGGSHEQMVAVAAAWQALGDAEARAAYEAEADPAVGRLRQLFRTAVDAGGGPQGIIRHCKSMVEGANVQLEGHRRIAEGKIKRAEFMLGRVVGPGLWATVCRATVAEAEADLAGALAEIEINHRVLAMLAEYRDA